MFKMFKGKIMRKLIDRVKNFGQFLNEQQNNETNFNDNFWKWFGNSKVVDKQGKSKTKQGNVTLLK